MAKVQGEKSFSFVIFTKESRVKTMKKIPLPHTQEHTHSF